MGDGDLLNYGMLAVDTFLVAETPGGLDRVFGQFEKALEACGMALNPKKCKSLQIGAWQAKKKWFAARKPTLTGIDGSVVEAITIGECYRYLGIELGTGGVETPEMEKLEVQLAHLKASLLKHQWKLHIIRTIVLPAWYYLLTLGKYAPRNWKQPDRLVRKTVREILHLPHDTPIGFFHACKNMVALPSHAFLPW